MQIQQHLSQAPFDLSRLQSSSAAAPRQALEAAEQTQAEPKTADDGNDLKEAFSDFVGQTFFAEMIKAVRTTQQPSAYFHGGRAEEIFQGQFDQVLTEKLSQASSEKIADPMFELFMLKRAS